MDNFKVKPRRGSAGTKSVDGFVSGGRKKASQAVRSTQEIVRPKRFLCSVGRIFRLSKLRNALSYLSPTKYKTAKSRAFYTLSAAFFLLSALIPTVTNLLDRSRAQLSDQVVALLDTPSEKLARKITFDEASKTFHFNKEERKAPAPATTSGGDGPSAEEQAAAMAQLQSQVTGKDGGEKTLYSVDMPQRIEDGFTYYDNNLGVSFKLIPEGVSGRGVLRDNRLIYTLNESGYKAIFTAKANGIKEDIILSKQPAESTLAFRYRLDLPKSLEAKLLPSGELGIYSADPSLYGNISFGSDEDRTRVMNARENGVKNYLVFTVPAPVIKESGNQQNANAKFLLSDDKQFLTIYATDLDKASYPLSIDPTVVVTSNSDFDKGNLEDNVNVGSDQIYRNPVSGGSIGTFSQTGLAQLPLPRSGFMSAMHNGYIYIISNDGADPSVRDVVTYAKIQDDGTIGSWTTDTTIWPGLNLRFGGLVAYNGWLYFIAGVAYGNQTESSATYGFKLDPNNGSLGPRVQLTSISGSGRQGVAAFAYNGWLYFAGGVRNDPFLFDTDYSQVQRARINADGTLGAWSTSGVAQMNSSRIRPGHTIMNGYVYMIGGRYVNTFGIYEERATYEFARLNENGDITSWTIMNSGSALFNVSAVSYAGYVYIVMASGTAGWVYAAEVTGSGTPGSIQIVGKAVGNTGSAVAYGAAYEYKGYIYTFGGIRDGSNGTTTVDRAPINPAGTPLGFSAKTAVGGSGRTGAASVAYGGHLYVMGGNDGTNYLNDIQRATMPTDDSGTLGAWTSAGSAFTTGRAFASAAVHDGRVYISGGVDSTGSVINGASHTQSIPIDMATGNVVGSWTSEMSPGNGRHKHGMVAYNNNLYLVGGATGSIGLPTATNQVQRAVLSSAGTITGWSFDSTFAGARFGLGVTLHGKTIYLAGGTDGASLLSDVQYAKIQDDGSLTGWSDTGKNIGAGRSGLGLVSHNGHLYVMGGLTGSGETNAVSTVQFASVNNDGTINDFITTGPLVQARAYAAFAVQNATLAVATGGSDGSIGSTKYAGSEATYVFNGGSGINRAWGTPTTSNFTTARSRHASVAYNGFLYVIGGTAAGTPEASIRRGTITSGGTISTWNTDASLPAQRYGHEVVINNGYLYIVGGRDNTGAVTNTVYYAKLDKKTGAIGSWSTATPLITAVADARVTVYNGRVYITGGTTDPDAGTTVNHVRSASITATGGLGSWDNTTGFAAARSGHIAFAVNGYLYVGGGLTNSANNTTALRDLQYAQINSIGSVVGGVACGNQFAGGYLRYPSGGIQWLFVSIWRS